jgi:hypothetical protein
MEAGSWARLIDEGASLPKHAHSVGRPWLSASLLGNMGSLRGIARKPRVDYQEIDEFFCVMTM